MITCTKALDSLRMRNVKNAAEGFKSFQQMLNIVVMKRKPQNRILKGIHTLTEHFFFKEHYTNIG